MSGFSRTEDGLHARFTVRFTAVERRVLANLAAQLAGVLETAPTVGSADPALRRLLPDAYPDDAEASAEFRRFTSRELVARKVAGAEAVMAALDGAAGDTVTFGADAAEGWLRFLTDLRLTLAVRLGIEHDDDEGRLDEESLPMQEVYHWLGFLQETLVEALSPD